MAAASVSTPGASCCLPPPRGSPRPAACLPQAPCKPLSQVSRQTVCRMEPLSPAALSSRARPPCWSSLSGANCEVSAGAGRLAVFPLQSRTRLLPGFLAALRPWFAVEAASPATGSPAPHVSVSVHCATWLMESQVPSQGLNLSTELTESQPPGHSGLLQEAWEWRRRRRRAAQRPHPWRRLLPAPVRSSPRRRLSWRPAPLSCLSASLSSQVSLCHMPVRCLLPVFLVSTCPASSSSLPRSHVLS